MLRITYTRAALKSLRRMPANTSKLIRGKIEVYAADRASETNYVTSLKGRAGVRLRVVDWRVITDDDGTVLAVLAIGPRGGV